MNSIEEVDYKDQNFILLLVDDHKFVIKGLQRFFKADFKVEIATSKDEALKFLQSKEVGVCVCDQHMPDGVEILETIREKYQKTRRIMLTSDRHEDTLLDALGENLANSVVYKPYDKAKLKVVVIEQVKLYLSSSV